MPADVRSDAVMLTKTIKLLTEARNALYAEYLAASSDEEARSNHSLKHRGQFLARIDKHLGRCDAR